MAILPIALGVLTESPPSLGQNHLPPPQYQSKSQANFTHKASVVFILYHAIKDRIRSKQRTHS